MVARNGKLAGRGKHDVCLGRVVQVKKGGGGNPLFWAQREIFHNYDETKSKKAKNKKNWSKKMHIAGRAYDIGHGRSKATWKWRWERITLHVRFAKISLGIPVTNLRKEIEELRQRTTARAVTFLVKVKAHRGKLAYEEADIQADKAIWSKNITMEWHIRTDQAVFTWQEPLSGKEVLWAMKVESRRGTAGYGRQLDEDQQMRRCTRIGIVCCFVLLNWYWGIVMYGPGASLWASQERRTHDPRSPTSQPHPVPP